MAQRLLVVCIVLVLVATTGCLDPFRPRVDAQVVAASEHSWRVETAPQEDGGILGPNIARTEYRFDPGEGGPPYPGVLVLFGVRAVTRPDTGDLLERTRDRVDELLAEEEVTVDQEQERRGERVLSSGARTQWFMLVGTSQSGSALFEEREEVRVLGEAWYDGRSSTTVIAVALAQTTGTTGILPQEVRDHAVWNELAGDPGGSVAGALDPDGFVYHTRSHG